MIIERVGALVRSFSMSKLPGFLYKPWFWFAAYVCWFAVLYILSEQPAFGPQAQTFQGSDKVAHAVYFAGGATGFGLGLLFWRRGFSRWGLLLILIGISLAVGIFDEWHQSTTMGRDGNSPGDVIADVVGGVLGFFICQWLLRFAEKKRPVAELAA